MAEDEEPKTQEFEGQRLADENAPLHAPKNSDARLGPACADVRGMTFIRAKIATAPGDVSCGICLQLMAQFKRRAELAEVQAPPVRPGMDRVVRKTFTAPIAHLDEYRADWAQLAADQHLPCVGFLTRYYDHFSVQLFCIAADKAEDVESSVRWLKDKLETMDNRPVEELKNG